jgi:predicted anti-sigma-YlaC factor YlaD
MRMIRCWRVRRRLQSYLDGEATPRDVALITSHLEMCIRCGVDAATLSRAIQQLRQLRSDVDPATLASLDAAVRRLTT